MDVAAPERDLSPKAFAALGIALVLLALGLRLAYAEFGYLTEGDQSYIAYAAIGLERGAASFLYNYPEQMGYYELARLVHKLLPGNDLERIRDIMIAFSGLSGTILTALALLAFPRQLSRPARLFFGFILLLSPVLWRIAQYGNTAILSGTLVFAAFVAASRLGGLRGALAATLLFAAAKLVRSDALLVSPALAYYLWKRERGSLWHAVLLGVGLGLAIVLVRLRSSALGLVPLSDSLLKVMFNTIQKGFWLNHLYWGLGPTILLAAAAGWPALGRMPVLWRTAVFWVLPPFLFYLSWSTTPRYAMLLVVPVAMCAALGIDTVVKSLARRHVVVRWCGYILLFALLCQPLFLLQTSALPGTPPGETTEWIKPLTYQAGDGPHFYGALLMQKRFPMPRKNYPRDFAGADLAALVAESAGRKERWVVIIDFWDDIRATTFHLMTLTQHPFKQDTNHAITIGNVQIDFCFANVVEALTTDAAKNQRTIERLRADRLFRETWDEGRTVIPKLKSIFGNGIVVTPRGSSGELLEITLPPPSESLPASRPATR